MRRVMGGRREGEGEEGDGKGGEEEDRRQREEKRKGKESVKGRGRGEGRKWETERRGGESRRVVMTSQILILAITCRTE